MKFFFIFIIVLTLPLPLLAEQSSADPSGPISVVHDIESSLAPKNAKTVYRFMNRRTDGTESEYTVLFEIRDVNHARGFFTAPPREKGREILRINEEIWTWLPGPGRVVRVADRESFAGGDFSNADILRVDWSAQYNITLKKELKDQWIFELSSRSNTSTYARILLWVDRKSGQPVQQIFYDSRGTKLKRLRYGEIRNFGPIQRPSRLVMENLITKQHSEMHVLQLEIVPVIRESRFLPDNLGK